MQLRNMNHRTLLMSLATMLWATTASVAKGYFARAKMYFGAPVQVGYLDYFKSFFVEEVKPPPPFFSWEYFNHYLQDDMKTWWAENGDIFDSMILWYLMGMLVCYEVCQQLRRRKLDLPCWFRGFTSTFARNKETAKESPPPSTGSPFPSGLPACPDDELNQRMDFIEGLLTRCIEEKQKMRDEQSALLEKLMDHTKEFKKLNGEGRLRTIEGIMARVERLQNQEMEQECENESESESSSEEPEEEPEATSLNQPQEPFLIETEDSIILL